MSRKTLIAGNWKMNCTAAEARELIGAMRDSLNALSDKVDILVCPPFTALESAYNALKDSSVALGAQNLYFMESGAYTGEISVAMVKEFCSYVIIGHSERRTLLSEGDEAINSKIKAALAGGLKVILCVGEDYAERQCNNALPFVSRQIKSALQGVTSIENITIAYEPIWAIGTGEASSTLDAESMSYSIRKVLGGLYGQEAAATTRILYGGSVKPENIADFVKQENIDGALVGGASLNAESFVAIAQNAAASQNPQNPQNPAA